MKNPVAKAGPVIKKTQVTTLYLIMGAQLGKKGSLFVEKIWKKKDHHVMAG